MTTPHDRAALRDKDYRDAYVDGHVTSYIPYQLRAIREHLGLTQKAFAERIGKPQSVVSRLENTEYGKVTVQTLLDIAHGLDIALVVKFASFPEFLATYDDLSAEAMAVEPYAADAVEAAEPAPTNDVFTRMLGSFSGVYVANAYLTTPLPIEYRPAPGISFPNRLQTPPVTVAAISSGMLAS
jgi:transcriptional regulator with XRE-family HTH domain